MKKLTFCLLLIMVSSIQMAFAKDAQPILNDKATCELFKPIEEFEIWRIGDYAKLKIIKDNQNTELYKIYAGEIRKYIDSACPTTEIKEMLGEINMYNKPLCEGIASKIYAGDKARIESAVAECYLVNKIEYREKLSLVDGLEFANKAKAAACPESKDAISDLNRKAKDVVKEVPVDPKKPAVKAK